ncbi:hypothetical protein BBJ28_00016363 [Nothophytophthora sp. Chile5]|nr:hypothetical protein BBJ28_00016363 [Nothophytophthora sp. Chile5]
MHSIFGDTVVVKQDPFHVITRFTEKIRESSKKKWVAEQLSAAIYDIHRNLRQPAEMEKRFKAVVNNIRSSSISVKPEEWEGAASATQHRPWERLYEMLQLRMGHVESRLLQQRALADDIGALLTSTAKSRKSMNRGAFVGLLGLEPEYDAASEFSAHEYSLLKQLRAEQLSTKKPWSQCAVVATILYNTAVQELDNPSLGVKKRGFRAISKRLSALDALLEKKPRAPSSQRIVPLTEKLINDEEVTPDEEALLKQLFEMIRTSALKKKKQVYFLVFDFAASACSGIAPKSQHFLQRRWESLKRSQNRNITKTAVKLDAELQQMTFITPSPPLRSADTASTGCELNAVARAVGGDGTVSSVEQHCTSNGNTDGGLGECMAGVVGCAVEGGGVMGGGVTGVEVVGGDLVVGGVEGGGVMGGVEGGGVMGGVADGVKAFLAESTGMLASGHQRQIASASAVTLPALDTLSVLDNITRIQLLDKAALIPARTKGKWDHLHAEYLRTYPASNLSKNALRLRLIGRRRKRADLSLSINGTEDVGTPVAVATESPPTEAPQSNKRAPSACDSCRARKRKCGPTSVNTQCKYRKIEPSSSIASFFEGS